MSVDRRPHRFGVGRDACFPDRERHVPRYFFHRIDGAWDLDPEGIDLPSLDHARHEAVIFAADTLKDDPLMLWTGGEVRIEVVDSAQARIFTVVITAEDYTSTARS